MASGWTEADLARKDLKDFPMTGDLTLLLLLPIFTTLFAQFYLFIKLVLLIIIEQKLLDEGFEFFCVHKFF